MKFHPKNIHFLKLWNPTFDPDQRGQWWVPLKVKHGLWPNADSVYLSKMCILILVINRTLATPTLMRIVVQYSLTPPISIFRITLTLTLNLMNKLDDPRVKVIILIFRICLLVGSDCITGTYCINFGLFYSSFSLPLSLL